MIDVDHMYKAPKCAWINRFTNGNNGAWKIIPDNTKERVKIGRRLHAWWARLILIETKQSSGTTNTLQSTIKLCFFQRGATKEWYDNGKLLPFDTFCRMFDVTNQ